VARLFGTNGVRGVANVDLTPELAHRLGRAIASWLPNGSAVAVARDARTSGPMLEAAATAGLLASGARVIRLGIAPTPAAQYYVKTHDAVRAGLVVTASHNPPEFNGLKLVAGDGTEASRTEEEAVEALYVSQRFRTAPWDGLQPIEDDETANPSYLEAILGRVDRDAIRARRLRVVADMGGGPSILTTLPLLRELGCDVTPLFEELDGAFRGRKSEPTPDNLSLLLETVRRTQADLGLAHDGDADRCIFVDERGTWVSGDLSFALLARAAVRRAGSGTVCTPVATSSVVEEAVRSAGGRVEWTAVGSPIVARAMMRSKAVFGGEENGGVIFPELQHCRDGAMTAAKMLELLAHEAKPLSALVASLPKYHVVKLKFPVPPEAKDDLLGRLKEWVGREFAQARVDTTDGLKVYTDRGWVLIRASGTEPIFRVFAESKDEKAASQLAERLVEAGRTLAAPVRSR
jgi:phosphomannomutase / phosphoglucomutase